MFYSAEQCLPSLAQCQTNSYTTCAELIYNFHSHNDWHALFYTYVKENYKYMGLFGVGEEYPWSQIHLKVDQKAQD